MKILNFILIICGLTIMVLSIHNYFKITKDIKNKKYNITKKLDKLQVLVNITVGFIYLVMGILVILKFVSTKYIFNYVLIIILLGKIIKVIIIWRYKSKQDSS